MVGRTVGLKGWDLMGHFMELEAQKVSLGKIVLKWFTHLIESPMQIKLPRSKSKCNNFLKEIVYAKNLPTPPT